MLVEEHGAQMLLSYLHAMVGSQLADSRITSHLWLKSVMRSTLPTGTYVFHFLVKYTTQQKILKMSHINI